MSGDTNGVFQVPRWNPYKLYSLRRSRFLNGDITTYFAPGQPPDCFPTRGTPTIGRDGITADDIVQVLGGYAVVDKGYAPPDDWNPAGTLLRVPQVVWLSWAYFWTIIQENSANYIAVAQNAFQAFWGAKQQIESMRPGRTFVEIIDWTGYVSDEQGNAMSADLVDLETLYASFHAGTWTPPYQNFGVYNQALPVLCPDLSALPDATDAFFGTQFLHIWAGEYAEDWVYYIGDSLYGSRQFTMNSPIFADQDTWGDSPYAGETRGPEPADEAAVEQYASQLSIGISTIEYLQTGRATASIVAPYQNSLSLMSSAHPLFSKFGCIAFPTELYGSYSDAWILAYTTSPFGEPYLFYVVYDSGTADSFLDFMSYANQAIFDRMAEDFKDYGFELGGGSSLITSKLLVSKIADFFGFDPDTGADLPVSPPRA